jgi:TrmH family RNA methyltransferase
VIESLNNPQIKNLLRLKKKAKTRYEQRVFLSEGLKMCQEAPKEWVKRMYASESFAKDHMEFLEAYPYEIVKDEIFKAVSDTTTPQGIMGLIQMASWGTGVLFGKNKNPLYLFLEGIQDPGNLGTILRTAEGAGVTAVFMDKHCADLYQPKVIRSTMGSIYRVPCVIAEDFEQTLKEQKEQGITLFAADLEGSIGYEKADYQVSCGILIGNEGNGLSEKALALADFKVHIPMEGQVESLNAAVATAILLYEAKRQRKAKF